MPDTINTTKRASTLHLGVLVQPYREGGVTTGDVAGFLEAKYSLMATFYRVHEADIGKAIESSLQGAMESGMEKSVDPFGEAMQTIQEEFRDFISSREAERVGIPGTPTQAALNGVNHRLKQHPYAKSNPRRPSFRDTGMLMASFRAWVD